MDCSPPGSSVCGILQARILEWDAMLSSRGFSQPSDWTMSFMSPALAGRFFTTSAILLQILFHYRLLQDIESISLCYGLPRWFSDKECTCQYRRHGFDPSVRKIPWRRKWQPTPVFWPGEPMDREPGGLQLMGSQKVGHDWLSMHALCYTVGPWCSSISGRVYLLIPSS